MLLNRWYVAILLLFVLGSVGYVHSTSDVVQVVVRNKSIETAQGIHTATEQYVIYTDRGPMPLLRFPVIGYTTGLEQTYESIAKGSKITVRAGKWPPQILGGHSKPVIMAVH